MWYVLEHSFAPVECFSGIQCVCLTLRLFRTFRRWDSSLAQVDLKRVPDRERTRLSAETKLLSSLHHPHVINFLGVWEANQQVCFTTEIVTSGTLKQYINRVFEKGIKLKIIQKWCRQIASGVQYLHAHDPPIIHRDIKCDNIFINGHSGDICIGAWIARCQRQLHARVYAHALRH